MNQYYKNLLEAALLIYLILVMIVFGILLGFSKGKQFTLAMEGKKLIQCQKALMGEQ
jgi:hypothetical protein